MLSQDEVKHIALLARVGVRDEEVEKYQKDLSAVLDFFRELEELDTENVALIDHSAEATNVARTDMMANDTKVTKEALLSNVPETRNGFVKVKSVF
ncbi:MAG: Asp-tRNA(Asn)/Glu-tRNA(Gln) amidotransferase subunit GatC [Candidatus Moranbacteria bacterium]|nr:Asp-tRNA(Asn)/Glu-tRNA(Gln) amidotransferase subunit GatC [Candidatus Moranbacteria bacterium]